MTGATHDLHARAGEAQNAITRVCATCSQPFEPTRRWHRYCADRCRSQASNARRQIASDPRLRLFFSVVAARMAKGATEYADRSWSADPETLAREILEELVDVGGWAAIMFARVSAIAEAARRLREEAR